MRYGKLMAAMAVAMTLAGCATQQGMTLNPGPTVTPPPKYRNAMAVRGVGGGRAMDALTRPGVTNEPFMAALQGSLALNGFLAQGGAAKYSIEAEIHELQQPILGLDLEVTSSVTYRVTGGGTTATYPISATAIATFADSPIAVDRLRIANERAMQENIKKFLQALK